MRLKVFKDSLMVNFSLRLLLAFLAAPAVFVTAQDTTEGFITITPSPDSTDFEPFPTVGPTVPGRNATFFPGPRTTPRPPYMNTSRPIDRPTLTRPDPRATITSWTTEIVTITSCPCGYGYETTELCTSSRTLTVTLTSTIKGCNHGYSGCNDIPEYPAYPGPTQEPPHYGEGDDEETGCNEDGEYGGDEDLGECYGREEGCDNYEYGQDDAGGRHEDSGDGHGESYDESKPEKQGHRKEKGGHGRKGKYAYSDPDPDSEQKGGYGDYELEGNDIAYYREHNGGYDYHEKDVSSDYEEQGAYNRKQKDVHKGSGYDSIGKVGYGEYDQEEKGDYDRRGGGVYVHISNGKGVHHQKQKNRGGDYGVGELESAPRPAYKKKGGYKLKGIDHEEDGQRHKKKPGKGYHHKKPQTHEDPGPKYEDQDEMKAHPEKHGGSGKHERFQDRVVPVASKPPIKHFGVTVKRQKRQHEQKSRKCTKTGGPKLTDDQKHEPTSEPTGPGQCHGGCGGPDSTSTMTTTVMTTITPSVTKPITPTTTRLSVSSHSITPFSTTALAQTETGSAIGTFVTGTSTASSMPTFIAGAARLRGGAEGWGMLVACMWMGMVAIGFGMGF